MAPIIEDLGSSGADKFKIAQEYLLPNEAAQLVCQTREGFLILSSRRVVFLKEEGRSEYTVKKTIPYDCILGFEPKKSDRFEISGIALDQCGCHTKETASFDVRVPRGESGEDPADVRKRFQSSMSRCFGVVEEIRNSREFSEEIPLSRDYSYLKIIPESLTRNAILDLNTVLRDMPIHDLLVREAVKFLGYDPFLLEESLRNGNDEENGILFAAGTQGYYWIQGMKTGRFMKNVIVDTVEWDHIKCFVHQWQTEDDSILATYTLTKGGKVSSKKYQWNPPKNENTIQFPWLLQPLNGPWILADIMYKCSGDPMPASWINETQSGLCKPRYHH